MNVEQKIRIGLVGVYRPIFKGDKIGLFARTSRCLMRLAKRMNVEVALVAGPVAGREVANSVAREAREAKLDLLMIQMSSFCGGEELTPFAKLQIPLGLWALPEPTSSGPLPLNSLCGLNLYVSILANKYESRPFKWFFGMAGDELFLSRFRVTVRALKAKKALAMSKVGLIGGHAPGFDNLAVDKRLVAKRLGMRVCEYPLEELFSETLKISDEEALAQATQMRRRSVACTAPDTHIVKVARFQVALRNIAEREGYDALAVRCWPEVPQRAGVMICAAMGGVADELPTACEGDVMGAAAMIALKAMSGTAPMLVDLSHVDEKDQSVLLWHCGNSPAHWADRRGTWLECHFNRDTMGAVRSMIFRPGPVTVFQLSDNGATAFTFTGRFLGGHKPSFNGSRGWLGKLKMGGTRVTVRDLLNTIFVQGLPHHFAVGAGDLSEEVAEFCEWLGLRRITAIQYRNALQRETIT